MKNKDYRIVYSFTYIMEAIGTFLWKSVKKLFKYIWKLLVFLAVMLLIFGSVVLVGAGYFYFSTVGEVPKLEDPSKIALPQDSTIYDVDENKIGVISSQRRYMVAGDEINQNMKNALVAIEDERFFNHDGIDFIGIGRAVYVDYQSWRSGGKIAVQGASTLTQQYVRLIYLTQETSIKRKLQEVTLAIQLEARLSKQEILDRYLNVVYFGNGNYGVEAAARYYFSKSAKDLTVSESVILSAVVNSSAKYDPTTEEGKIATFERARLVLNKMYELGYISREEMLNYKGQDFNILFKINESQKQVFEPYYYDFVMKELLKKHTKEEIYAGGWQIHTTLSIKKSDLMKQIIAKELGKGVPTAAMADVNPQTGAINAFIGGMNYEKSNFNLATQGKRQPGSSFKPFVYATAFKQGMRNDSPFSNAPITLKGKNGKPWSVKPDSHARTLQDGLAYSDNAMAVRLIVKTGIAPVISTAHDLGIKSDINDDVAIALGGLTYGVSPLEMASAYATFANEGVHHETYCIEKINNSYGDIVFTHTVEPKTAINTEIAAMMNHSLQGVVQHGTAANSVSLKNTRQVAGKTGTTDDHADTWFIGYTPNFSGAVWIGYPAKRTPIKSIKGQTAWGGTFSAKIWNSYATIVLKNAKVLKFKEPQGVVQVPVLANIKSIGKLKDELTKLGLSYNVEEKVDMGKSENSIIDLEKAGQLVPLHSILTITIAVYRYTVPDFSGLTAFEAVLKANTSASNGFNLKFVATLDDTIAPRRSGTVFSQSIPAGGQVSKGSAVTLTLKFQTPPPKTIIKKVPTPYIPTDSELFGLKQKVDTLNNQVAQLQADKSGLQTDLANEKNTLKLLTPNFIGMTVENAQILAQQLGFTVIMRNNTGTVTDQSVLVGTLPLNGAIVLTGGGA